MKKLLLSLVFLVGCSKGFEIKIDSRATNSANRVFSMHENLTYSNNGVLVTDDTDPIFHFMYESKIAAPSSSESIYGGTLQATSVSVLPGNKMVIAYNTKTDVVSGGIDVVDISNLQSPVIIYSYAMPSMEFADTKFKDNKLYLSGVVKNQGAALVTVDLTNLSAPTIVDTKLVSSYYGTSLSLQGTSLLLTTGDTGDVYSYSIDSSGIPQQVSREAYANLLYVQHYTNGYVVLFDDAGKTKLGYKNTVSNTFSSMVLRTVHFESPARFDINGNIAYVSTADEQVIEQVDLLTMTKIHTLTTTGRGNGLRYDSGLLYTAQGEEGFKLFDVRDQYSPVYKGRFNFDDAPSANNLWTFDVGSKKVVVLADGLGGVKIISQDLNAMPVSYCTFATSVVSYTPHGTIDATRKISSNVLGAPTGDIQNTINFTTLGKTGEIIVSFDVPIKNVPGPDLRVYEVSWDNKTFAEYPEQAQVYGSNDLITWTSLGVVKNDNGNPALGQVDLGSMTQAKYIKLVDITTSSVSDDGFDLEGFACMNQVSAPVCDPSTNVIKNGSFEMPSSDVGLVSGIPLSNLATTSPTWDVYSQIPFWTTDSGSGIEVQYSGVSTTAQNGSFVIELDSNPNATLGTSTNSKVSQTVHLNAGNYKMTMFYKARNPTGTTSQMKVLVDDVVVSTVNILNTQWNQVDITLNNLSLGNHKFSLLGTGTEDGIGALIDNVSLKQTCLP
jgi:hypothetical protein